MNGRPLLVPPGVVTVTYRVPDVADDAIANTVVNDVLLATFTGPTVTPVPFTATAVDPLTKFVPVTVTLTLVPSAPDSGRIAVIVGGLEILAVTASWPPPLAGGKGFATGKSLEEMEPVTYGFRPIYRNAIAAVACSAPR